MELLRLAVVLVGSGGDLRTDNHPFIALREGMLDLLSSLFSGDRTALGEGAHLIGDHGESRAASTAALSARMFVWNEISSIVLMILEISPLEAFISSKIPFGTVTRSLSVKTEPIFLGSFQSSPDLPQCNRAAGF